MSTAAAVLPESAPRPALPLLAYASFLFVCLVWGTTFVAIRVAIETVPTLLVTSIRFVGAGLLLMIFCWVRRLPMPATPREWLDHSVNGVIMVGIGNTSVVWAEHYLTSGFAALLAATIPLWTAILEAMSGEHRLTRVKVTGLFIGFGGVALLVWPALRQPEISLSFLLAVGAMQLSAISWNVGSLRSKRYPIRAGILPLAAIQMLAAGLVVGLVWLIGGGLWQPMHFSARSWTAVLYMMIFGSVLGYTAYHYALARLQAGKVMLYAYVNPAVAVVVGALLLAEPVTGRMMAAMAVILLGVAVARRG